MNKKKSLNLSIKIKNLIEAKITTNHLQIILPEEKSSRVDF